MAIQSPPSKCWLTASTRNAGPEFLSFQFCDPDSLARLCVTSPIIREMVQRTLRDIANCMQHNGVRFGPWDNFNLIAKIQRLGHSLLENPHFEFNALKNLSLSKNSGFPNYISDDLKLNLGAYALPNVESQTSTLSTLLDHITKLPALEELNLAPGTGILPTSSIIQLIEKAPQLKRIISRFGIKNPELLDAIKQKESLTHLVINYDFPFQNSMGCTFLKSVTFDLVPTLNDENAQIFAKGISLEQLTIIGCPISTHGIKALLSPQLRTLALSFFENIASPEGLPATIVEHAPLLQECQLTLPSPLTTAYWNPFFAAENLKCLTFNFPSLSAELHEESVQQMAGKFRQTLKENNLDITTCFLSLDTHATNELDENIFLQKFEVFCAGKEVQFLTNEIEEVKKL